MKRFHQLLTTLVMTVVMACTTLPVFAKTTQTTPVAVATEENAFEKEVFDLVNAERAKAGLPALTEKSVLIQDARVRAVESSALFEHTRPDGSSWWELDPANMYSECLCVRYKEYATPQQVVEAWMRSQTHKECLLRMDITTMGIGGYINSKGDVYVTFEGGFSD